MTSTPTRQTRWLARTVLVVRILLVLAFGAAGLAKLTGAAAMVQVFDAIGIGQWFRYVTGSVEVAGALLLLARRTTWLGALVLATTMVGAVFTHLAVIGGNPGPAALLLVLSGFVLWVRRFDLPLGLAQSPRAVT